MTNIFKKILLPLCVLLVILIVAIVRIINSNNIHGIWKFDSVINESKLQIEIDSTITLMKQDSAWKTSNTFDLSKPALINKSYKIEYLEFYGIASFLNYGKGKFRHPQHVWGQFKINKDSLQLTSGGDDIVYRSWIDYNSQHFYLRELLTANRIKMIGKDTLILKNPKGNELVYIKLNCKDPKTTWWDHLLYIYYREF